MTSPRYSNTPEYRRALWSPHWRALRDEVIAWRQAYRCAGECGQVYGDLQLHHLTYERLGQELPEDVVGLCVECHRKADRIRADEAWWRRIDAWARKRYGSWHEVTDADEYEFMAWLERQESEVA